MARISIPQLQSIRDAIQRLDGELADMQTLMSDPGSLPTVPIFFWPTSYRPAFVVQMFLANPANYARYNLPGHEGWDVRSGLNGHCICIANGVVVRVDAWPNTGNYGYSLRVEHKELGITSIYAHLNPSVAVPPVGSTVKGGQVLGLCDSTGNSSAAHLHLTIKDAAGLFVDPVTFLAEAYKSAGGSQALPVALPSFALVKT